MPETQGHRFGPILIGINAGFPTCSANYVQKTRPGAVCGKNCKDQN